MNTPDKRASCRGDNCDTPISRELKSRLLKDNIEMLPELFQLLVVLFEWRGLLLLASDDMRMD